MSNFIINKTYSSNPAVDYLLYYSKILAFGSVIKDEDEALHHETKQSMLNGDALIACIEGNAIFELFKYDEEVLADVGITNSGRVSKCIEDKYNIPDTKESIFMYPKFDKKDSTKLLGYTFKKDPEDDDPVYQVGDTIKLDTKHASESFREYKVKKFAGDKVIAYFSLRDNITKYAAQKFIRTYNEQNDYYRKLCGLPNLGDYGIPIMDYEYFDVNGIQEFINNERATYVHELSKEQILYLEKKGILDQIRIDYPDAEYLDYIACGLTPYKVRKAYEYQLLYSPTINDNGIVYEKFMDKYEENRLYVMSTFYSEGMKINSDYYTNFIGFMIMIMTITDILSVVHEDIIKRDIFDKRFIQYIFEIYGVPYYNTIPVKYQWRMCKNINKLIQYKSCPKGMLNLIDLFGAENVEVFKYFILRDRNVDKWGDLIYNTTHKKRSYANKVLFHNTDKLTNVNTGGVYFLNIPSYKNKKITNFVANKALVWYKNTLLSQGTDYSISSNTIHILKPGISDGTIYIDYYWNKESIESHIDKKHAIYTRTEKQLISSSGKIELQEYQKFNPAYFTSDNDIILIIDDTIYSHNEYNIDHSTGVITLADPESFVNNMATIIYIWGDNVSFKFSSKTNISKSGNKFRLGGYAPFEKYFENGNSVVLTTAGSDGIFEIISDKEYKIITKSSGDDKPGDVIFTNDKYNKISAHFIYSDTSIYNQIKLYTSTETFTSNERFKVTFKLNPPGRNFFKNGYRAYVRLRNQKNMLSSDLYDIYNNTLTLRDQALGLHKGQKLEVTYVAGPDNPNIKVQRQKITNMSKNRAENKKFKLNFPEKDFFKKGNNIVVDVIGNLLIRDEDYVINGDTLEIINPNKYPYKNQGLVISYIMSTDSKDKIRVKQSHIIVDKLGQSSFDVHPPFDHYVESGQGAIVTHNDNVLADDFKLTPKSLKLIGGDVVEYGDRIHVLWVYNYRYEDPEESSVAIASSNPISVMDVDDLVQLKVPYPFDDFESNGWFMYTTYEDGTLIPEDEYDIRNGYFSFSNPRKHTENKKIVFHFIYINSERFVEEYEDEEYDKNITLKFIGSSLKNEFFNKDIISRQNTLSYDEVTIADVFWDGVEYDDDRDDLHERVKHQILAKKFNYERTKYFGINYVMNIAEMSFNISYFYNIFFDDVFKEDNLKVSVPSIVPYKKFNVAYLFTYMNALAYLYAGMEDTIIDTTGKILYVKGFNFKADIDKLKKWIWDQRRKPDNFDTTFIYSTNNKGGVLPKHRTKKVWDIDLKKGDDNVFKDMNELVSMFKTNRKPTASNKDIYQFIVKNIFLSQDADIYHIWKKLYDTLMTYRQSFEYYKITDDDNNTRIASTLTEFLKYKDTELYTDLMEIKNISDKTLRNETITERISDVVYILNEYIDSDTFRNIFDHLPGVSGGFFLDILFTIINFFKSYKIVLRSKGDYIIFNADDPYLNTLKFIDLKEPHIYHNFSEYLERFRIDVTSDVYTHYYDRIGIDEYIDRKIDIADSINDKYLDYAKEHDLPTTNTITVRVKVPKNQIITIFTSTGKVYTTNVAFGSINARKVSDFKQKDLVTYYYSYKLNKEDVVWQGFTKEGEPSYEKFKFIPISKKNPTGYKSKDVHDYTEYPYTKDKPFNEETSEYIIFTLKYGEEFYAVLDGVSGYEPGRLNRYYGYAQDEDMDVYATEATPITKYIHIIAPVHTHITAVCDGEVLSKDQSFEARIGLLITFTLTFDSGYHGKTLFIDGKDTGKLEDSITIENDVEVRTDAVEVEDCTVRIITPENENIRFVYGIETIIVTSGTTKELKVPLNSPYIIRVGSSTAYSPGKLNVPSSGILTKDMLTNGVFIITTTPAVGRMYRVNIIQTEHQIIHVWYNNIDHTESFDVPIYGKVRVDVVADRGYSAGRPLREEYTISSDTDISALPAIPKKFVVVIKALEHETITFTNGGMTTTIEANQTKEIENVLNNSYYIIKVHGDHGYDGGKPNIPEKGVIDYDMADTQDVITITTSPVTLKNMFVTILQSSNQLITVICNGVKHTSSFIAPYMSDMEVTIESTNIEFAPGKLNVANKFKLSNDIEISATNAGINKPQIKINKYDGQRIVVWYNGNKYTDTFNVLLHGDITAYIEPINDYYITGELNMTSATNIIKDIELTATPATIRTFIVSILQSSNQKIQVECEGKIHTETFEAHAGSKYSIVITPNPGYTAGRLTTAEPNGYVLKDMIVNATVATKE